MKKALRLFSFAAMAAMLLASCQKSPKTATLDFEGSTWDALVDNAQYGGTLLYGTYDEAAWTWNVATNYTWSDGGTMLEFTGFTESWGSLAYSSGGEAISNYVAADYTGKGYMNQLEIPIAPKSGKNFAVHFGSADPTASKGLVTTPIYPMLRFADNQPRTILSMAICPTNYVLNSCINGDGYFGPISGETTLYAKAIAFDASGKATLASSIKLIDGADVAAYKAGSKTPAWKTWDLSELGAVCGLILSVYGTSDYYADYGFNAPAYFAYDDIVVELPAE